MANSCVPQWSGHALARSAWHFPSSPLRATSPRELAWLEETRVNLLDDPAIGAVISSLRDITDRKAYDEACRSSEERYRDLVENANDVIYTHDVSGNITSWNHAGEALTGYRC